MIISMFDCILFAESSRMLMTTNTLVLENVTSSQSGHYSCSATNYITAQTVQSQLVTTLSVLDSRLQSAPKFLYTPQSLYVVQNGMYFGWFLRVIQDQYYCDHLKKIDFKLAMRPYYDKGLGNVKRTLTSPSPEKNLNLFYKL